MALYRQIYTTFWTDPKVDDDFSPEDKYFYLYLLTNSHTNVCGCYEISMKQFCRELGYNEDTVKLLIKRMDEVHDVIRYNGKTKEVLILNWYKYNWSLSPNFIKGVKECIPYIKSDDFRNFVQEKLDKKINSDKKKENKNRQSGTVEDGIPTSVYSSDYSPVSSFGMEYKDKIEGGMGEGREDEVMVFEVDKNDSQVREDFAKVISVWNETDFRSVTRIYPKSQRGVWLKARINEYGVEDVIKAIRLANTSQFLKDSGWFDFEWFVRPNNFVKVLEGKYKDGIRSNGTAGYSGNGKKEFHEWDFLEPDVGRES